MRKVVMGLSLSMAATAVTAGTINGQVLSPEGLPVSGAMISISSSDSEIRKTGFTDTDGNFQLVHEFEGSLPIRVRTPFYADYSQTITQQGDHVMDINFTLEREKNDREKTESLPASAHAAMLDWTGVEDAHEAFVSQCNYCHQIGNSLTRTRRDAGAWLQTINRMEGYISMLTDDEAQRIAQVLAEGFDGQMIDSVKTYEDHDQLSQTVIEEWFAGDGLSFIHDADVASNGKFYGADEGHDIIWELDPITGKIVEYPLPDIDMPVGGYFSGLELPLGIFTGKHGPHSMVEDKRTNKLWITNSLSSYLISFDIHTKQFEMFDIGEDTRYLHTIRIDDDGILWFTVAASNQVVRFDPISKEKEIIDLPSNGWKRWMTDAFLPTVLDLAANFKDWDIYPNWSHHKTMQIGREVLTMPYGLDVHPTTGQIWYSKLDAHKIGVIDPDTLDIEEFDTPLKGPRRPRFDTYGNLWIPSFEEGALMKFDSATKKFSTYDIPTLADNQVETPYALNIHPKTGEIWLTSNASDRVFTFDPVTESFRAFPSPTRVTFLRDMVFTKEGKVCSSSSNLPAYAIEGGRPSFICFWQPNR
ncbi:carboxypeptidase regulatory-like domain-containing protein [Thalassotalea eurytherma]|uniref:Lyase n=1 Tax=Thalassotalea eurytherma TaxID=1144278 RepID=A0ABQ6GXN0_9GAMM|nr:carboxypeptidase regulatory-like domain-containing protein [Thalassotalea eurytherma]GLX80607.1 hypothetical protein theurythT_00590 [Thalassotalea eurytherma]